jgi:hypothetical protein
MIQRDYVLDQAKEFARFIALLLGLVQKSEIEEAHLQMNGFLAKKYQLTENFTFEDVLALYQNKQINLDEIKGILQLVIFRGELFQDLEEKEKANIDFEKALQIIDFLEKNSKTFDFDLVKQKNNILKYCAAL